MDLARVSSAIGEKVTHDNCKFEYRRQDPPRSRHYYRIRL